MSDSTVTIGLPVHNSARSVLETIRSVFAQTYPDWKLLIIDDCSTDGSYELLSRIDDDRVTVVKGEQNLGLASRLNEIAQRTTTPLLARLDSDDVNHPQRLELQVAYLNAHPDVDFVVADGISIDAESRPRGYRTSIPDASVAEHFVFGPYIHSVITGRTEWFRNNPYDTGLLRAEDQDLWLRTLGKRKTVVQELPLLYVREAGYVTADKYRRSLDATKVVIRRHAPAHLNRFQTFTQLAFADAKKAIYTAAEKAGVGDRVVALRSRKLSEEDVRHHYEVLATIQATKIPGIDD
ncbi:Glycosyltransferase involved in cell wall bisynthesis [Raineyella antarctica]|uniref:Glycosyltransferase involved in cell wall bisynthesis n=1 Tax=Raineyella antarctica TaxID=1577474 RepID=A0A1G6H6I3_9ACTN|nr:glycosyltransferase family 2 protein [Raineyella antarctica]SDB89880.1 Glycosyltransferase involved in cell wall bisynthesis [Raineyella antarctica]